MTKERLEQLMYLKREIAQHKKRITQLEREYLTVQKVNDGTADRGLPIQVLQQVDCLKSHMEETLAELLEELTVLNRFIVAIDDSQMRQIFCLRYIDNLTWQQIAFRIGEMDESYPRRKHNEFLKKSTRLAS